MKRIKSLFIIILVVAVLIGCVYSEVFMWIFFGIIILVGTIAFLFLWLMLKDIDDFPEDNWGKDWRQLVADGKLSYVKPYNCVIDKYYSNKRIIEKCTDLQLPDFKVVSCKETLRDVDGSFFGEMEIEFIEDFSSTTKEVIKSRINWMIKKEIKSKKEWPDMGNKLTLNISNSDDEREYWNLTLSLDSRIANIDYGHN